MKITLALEDGAERVVNAEVVPDTEKLLAIRKNGDGYWDITHVPTGYIVCPWSVKKTLAIKIAKKLFKVCSAIRSTDPDDVVSGTPKSFTEWMRKVSHLGEYTPYKE